MYSGLPPGPKAAPIIHQLHKRMISLNLRVGDVFKEAGIERRQWYRWVHGADPSVMQVGKVLKVVGLAIQVVEAKT